MPLPTPPPAKVDPGKIVDYLLNPGHSAGASKARFFTSFGFTRIDWSALAEALRQHGETQTLMKTTLTGFGPRFEIEGPLETPCGLKPRIYTVWQLDEGELASRLITAYFSPLSMIDEHDLVVLLVDLPTSGLFAGDVGTVVHMHKANAAYEVEFVSLQGETVAIETLQAAQVRRVQAREMAHVRELQPA